MLGLHQQAVHRRLVADADQHERRLETRRAEGAHRHAVVSLLLVTCGDDRDATAEAAECGAERVRIDHCALCAELESGRTKSERRYLALRTARAGTKSPVT